MLSSVSGCALKLTLTHIRGRDHREWGQGRGGPWRGNSDRNMHCFSLDWGKDHLVGPHMESTSEHLHWLWWGVLWRELDTPRLKWTRGSWGSSSRSLSKPLVPVDPVLGPLLGPKECWYPEVSQRCGLCCAFSAWCVVWVVPTKGVMCSVLWQGECPLHSYTFPCSWPGLYLLLLASKLLSGGMESLIYSVTSCALSIQWGLWWKEAPVSQYVGGSGETQKKASSMLKNSRCHNAVMRVFTEGTCLSPAG